jgi:hypothetical protein
MRQAARSRQTPQLRAFVLGQFEGRLGASGKHSAAYRCLFNIASYLWDSTLGRVNESKDSNFGYNALTGKYEDLVKAGVLDPTKVVRTALINAGSIASLMLTTEALIAELPEDMPATAASSGHGGMGDMY